MIFYFLLFDVLSTILKSCQKVFDSVGLPSVGSKRGDHTMQAFGLDFMYVKALLDISVATLIAFSNCSRFLV